MSAAREIIARHAFGPAGSADLCANRILRELTAAGYRILGPDELRAALVGARDELAAVIEWSQTERAPLRPQELSSLKQRILQAGRALRAAGGRNG